MDDKAIIDDCIIDMNKVGGGEKMDVRAASGAVIVEITDQKFIDDVEMIALNTDKLSVPSDSIDDIAESTPEPSANLCTENVNTDNNSLGEPCCRVCHCSGDEEMISPCDCSGSVKWVHEACLVKWMKSSLKKYCELCRKDIDVKKRRKPLSKWKLPSQRPTPVLWVFVFVTAIALNLASVVKDASRRCSSTPCIVFYAVGCIGVVLGTLFLIYWSKRAKHFVNHWVEQNKEWVLMLETEDKAVEKYPPNKDSTSTSDRPTSLPI